MEKKLLKIGVIGMGRGLGVSSGVMNDENICVRAICDKNPERLAHGREVFENCDRHGMELLTFSDYEDLLRSDVDAVFVANYATEHVPCSIRALNAGKHVLSEIPSVNTLEEARQLKEAVAAHPELVYMPAENCCYWAFIREWKKMYDAGRFGDIVYAESEYLHPFSLEEVNSTEPGHWRKYIHAIRYLTHNLGPLLYIMNDRCVSVTCMETAFRYHEEKEGKEMGVALFRTEKGTVIRILINFGAYIKPDHNFRLQGIKGSIETDPLHSLTEGHSWAMLSDEPACKNGKLEIPVTTGNSKEGHGGADSVMFRDFVDCVLSGRKPELDADFAVNMSVPGIIAQESAERGSIPLEIPFI